MENLQVNQQYLDKFNIKTLNEMQKEVYSTVQSAENTMVLSPTGTGKTLAFALPLVDLLDPNSNTIQALILVPSRELAIQIEQVIRNMGSGYKVNAIYGGRAVAKDKEDLKHLPAILVGTPGRVADHFRRDSFSKETIKYLVLDEFDKSLETGFETDMRKIVGRLPNLEKRILTSATEGVQVPDFVKLKKTVTIDYLKTKRSNLVVKAVLSPTRNQGKTLVKLLNFLGDQPGIVFCNLKESVQIVSDLLNEKGIQHGCFYGGMEQRDRERSLIKFRNGTNQLIIATDLAARGIDIPEIKFIIHYELPIHEEEFIHRNGRTARVNADGTAYVLKWGGEHGKPFIDNNLPTERLDTVSERKPAYWATLFISGGRKDKISKGDVAGLFLKQGGLSKEELGVIELKSDCAFVSVPLKQTNSLIKKLNNTRLKKKKVRIEKI